MSGGINKQHTVILTDWLPLIRVEFIKLVLSKVPILITNFAETEWGV